MGTSPGEPSPSPTHTICGYSGVSLTTCDRAGFVLWCGSLPYIRLPTIFTRSWAAMMRLGYAGRWRREISRWWDLIRPRLPKPLKPISSTTFIRGRQSSTGSSKNPAWFNGDRLRHGLSHFFEETRNDYRGISMTERFDRHEAAKSEVAANG